MTGLTAFYGIVKIYVINEFIPGIFKLLLNPWVEIPSLKDKRRIILLTTSLLFYTLLLMTGAFITASRTDNTSIFLWISAAAVFIVYLISRTILYKSSIILSLIITTLPITLTLWFTENTNDPLESIMWFAFPIMICTLFSSKRMAFFTSISYLIGMLSVIIIRDLPFKILDSSIPFLITLFCLSIAIIMVRQIEQNEAEYEAGQRALTHRRLLNQERYFRSLIDSFNTGVLIIDPETYLIKDLNKTAALLLNNDRQDILGKNISTFISLSGNESNNPTISNSIPGIAEGEIRNEQTSNTPVLINFSVFNTEDIPQIFVGINDITERKRIEEREKMIQHELTLNSHLSSLGQMAAGIAHEINNPLAMLSLYADDLISSEIPEAYKNDIYIMHQQINRISNIVSGMLKYARNDETTFRNLSVNALVKEALELRTHELRTNNIEVIESFDPAQPELYANSTQLQQVLLNIIINAEKELASKDSKGKINVITRHDDTTISIQISDNGRGIKSESLDRIFEPFYSNREFGEGTGLGLFICHNIISDMGGNISVRNNEDEGTTFTIELPIHQFECS